MTIKYLFYEDLKDLQRQIDFLVEFPFSWKPTLSPNQFIEQQQSIRSPDFLLSTVINSSVI